MTVDLDLKQDTNLVWPSSQTPSSSPPSSLEGLIHLIRWRITFFPYGIGNRLQSLRPGAVITKTLIGLIGFKNLRSIGFSSSCAQWAYCFCLAHCILRGSHSCNISHLCTARVHSRLPSLGAFLIITRSFYLCASLLWHIAQILGEDFEGKKKRCWRTTSTCLRLIL